MPRTRNKSGARAGDAASLPARRRFTVEEYYQMAEAGILHEDERVELLDGEIFEMAALGSRHVSRITFLARWFITRLGERATVIIQSPVRLSDGSEPEPDLALLRQRPDDYEQAHPGPDDVLLLIEVADTSLAYDRDIKLPRYAEAGIPEVWIVDLNSNQVLVHRDRSATGYRTITTISRGESLSPAAFPDLVLPIDDLLR